MRHDCSRCTGKLRNMEPDKHDKRGKKEREKETVKSPDTVETPPPPQHMDPSKNPEQENDKSTDKKGK